ncbi:MAG TPA: YqiA/YcfP family alpha/beta fold hydrolase [Bryobacteraceae bacterium]|nr:YqiA/YcfP family alpha/beta fold hydrolase [Bryobacteraceae bacterium]
MLSDRLRVLYLHGFASSPTSRKAQFFAAGLRSRGLELEIPDLAQGDFEHLTITRQLQIVERLLDGAPATLIGSSLGGYLAALYASYHPEIHRLVLLAPAFDFYHLWLSSLGPEAVAAWKRNRTMPVFHYAGSREMPLDFEFIRDAARFTPFPHFLQPALLFHGNLDPVVPLQYSLLFAATHPNVRLIRLNSGHELTDVLDAIWLESQSFVLDSDLAPK